MKLISLIYLSKKVKFEKSEYTAKLSNIQNTEYEIINATAANYTVMIDIFDRDKSRANVRECAEQVEFLLDRKQLETTRPGTVRLYLFSGGSVPGADPRDIHYNLQFQARANRKSWLSQIT
jgi:hypothetical protein